MAKKEKKKKHAHEDAAMMAAAVEREAAAAAAMAQEFAPQQEQVPSSSFSTSSVPSMFGDAASAQATAPAGTINQSQPAFSTGVDQVTRISLDSEPDSVTRISFDSQPDAVTRISLDPEPDAVTRISFDPQPDPVTRIDFGAETSAVAVGEPAPATDPVTHIDFGTTASQDPTAASAPQPDAVTRLDFSADTGSDSVIRLDFSTPTSDDVDTVTRLDFSSPSVGGEPVAVAAQPIQATPVTAYEPTPVVPYEPQTQVQSQLQAEAAPQPDPAQQVQPIPESQPSPIGQLQVEPIPQQVSQNPTLQTQPDSMLQAQSQPEPILQTQPQPEPIPQVQAQPQPDPVLQAQLQPQPEPMLQAQPQADPMLQAQPQVQSYSAQQAQPIQQTQQIQLEPAQQAQQMQPELAQQMFTQPTQQVNAQPAPAAMPAQQVAAASYQQQPQSVTQTQPAAASASQVQSQPAALTDEERAADRAQAANKPSPDEVVAAKAGFERIIANVETVVIGKREPVSLVVLALIAKGHVLLEDLPGTGKTTLVSALARSIACDFSRIQFTPDIMPSDVSGFSIYNQKTNDFEFRPGGVMSNLVLADEINRASAKTQSALLEAMEERQVTVDGKTYRLPEPFMVLATQNPIEQFGTYPLPEAQVDRFLVKLSMGYPGFEQEVRVLELGDKAKKALTATVSSQDVLRLREVSNRVYASRIVLRYIVEVITATRDNPEVQVGSSPRGGIALLALSRAYALLQGRAYVIPDDVKYLAPHVLCHRISLAHEAKVAGRTERQVIESILSGIAVPYYDEAEAQGLK